MMDNREISLILLDIRSSENVGAMFRTADAAGVAKIYLVGYTPGPLDRFKRKNVKLAKSALGAEDTVPFEAVQDISELIARLKNEGMKVFSVEQSPNSIRYTTAEIPKQVAFIVGNEVQGISKNVLDASDAVLEIPMNGAKESLNVSVATGVILFHARNS